MAEVQRRQRDRFVRHLRKKVTVTLDGLRPAALSGRLAGSRVLINSIPKSGTHLLETVLTQVGPMRNAGWRTLVDPDGNREEVLRRLTRLGRGAMATAHLGYRDWLAQHLESHDIRMLLLVRDPRDIAVSRYRYATEIDWLHPAHAPMKALPDDSARLHAAIEGIPGAMPPLAQALDDFAGWLESAALVVRFEDLVIDPAAPEDCARRRRETLERVFEHIGQGEQISQLDQILGRADSRKSSTFRRGRVGGWREEFSVSHEEAFQQELAARTERYGYR